MYFVSFKNYRSVNEKGNWSKCLKWRIVCNVFLIVSWKKSVLNVVKTILMMESEPGHVLSMFLFFHQI